VKDRNLVLILCLNYLIMQILTLNGEVWGYDTL